VQKACGFLPSRSYRSLFSSIDSTGSPIVFADFSWESLDQGIATVDDSGSVTAVGTGATYVVAASGGVRDSSLVTVEIATTLLCSDAGAIVHDTNIVADETWPRAVHRVGAINVDGAVTLTIEPGALVCLGNDAGIEFINGARLDARGRADSLIVFTAVDEWARWTRLGFRNTPSEASYLTNVLIERVYDGEGALATWDQHAVIVDSAVIRDGTGSAAATLNLPAVPGLSGITMYFAYGLGLPWKFTSNPVQIGIVP